MLLLLFGSLSYKILIENVSTIIILFLKLWPHYRFVTCAENLSLIVRTSKQYLRCIELWQTGIMTVTCDFCKCETKSLMIFVLFYLHMKQLHKKNINHAQIQQLMIIIASLLNITLILFHIVIFKILSNDSKSYAFSRFIKIKKTFFMFNYFCHISFLIIFVTFHF